MTYLSSDRWKIWQINKDKDLEIWEPPTIPTNLDI